MPYMYSEMQNKLSKIRDSPLESMGQIISSRWAKLPTLESHMIQYGVLTLKFIIFSHISTIFIVLTLKFIIFFTYKHYFYLENISK